MPIKYVSKGAKLMCTGCPGMIARLDAKKAKSVKRKGPIQANEDDKKIIAPAFGTCIAIPTAPKKCSPNLVKWANVKTDVKVKGKGALMFPNMIPCTTGPGLVTMIDAG